MDVGNTASIPDSVLCGAVCKAMSLGTLRSNIPESFSFTFKKQCIFLILHWKMQFFNFQNNFLAEPEAYIDSLGFYKTKLTYTIPWESL